MLQVKLSGYCQAIKVQEILDPEDKGKRCDLLLTLCNALLLAMEPKRILDTVAPEAFSLAGTIGDSSRACQACLMAIMAIVSEQAGPGFATPRAAEWAERANHYAQPDTIERAWADTALGATRFYAGHMRSGYKLLTQAIDLARRLGDPNTLWLCGSILLLLQTTPQYAKDSERLAEELLASSRVGVNILTLAFALQVAANAFLALGKRQRAETVWDELRVLNERTGHVRLRRLLATMDAVLAVMDGRLEDALDMARQIRAQGEEEGMQGSANVAANIFDYRARVHLCRNLEALEGKLHVASTSRDTPGEADLLCLLCLVLSHLGRRGEVSEILGRFVVRRSRIGTAEDLIPTFWDALFLEAAVLTDHRPSAELLLKRFAGTGVVTSGIFHNTCIPRHMGGAAALQGKFEEAQNHYQEAIKVCTEMKFRPELALSRLELAELLLKHFPQEKSEAIAHLDFVIPEFRDMKMNTYLERALRHKEILKA